MSHVSLSLADTSAPSPFRHTGSSSGNGKHKSSGSGSGSGGGSGVKPSSNIGLSEVGVKKTHSGAAALLKAIPEGRAKASFSSSSTSSSSSSSSSSGYAHKKHGGSRSRSHSHGGGGGGNSNLKPSPSPTSFGRALGERASAAAQRGTADSSRAAMWQQVLHSPSPPQSVVRGGGGSGQLSRLKGGVNASGTPAPESGPTVAGAAGSPDSGAGAGAGAAAAAAAAPASSKTTQMIANTKAACDKIMKSRILVSLVVFLTTTILLLIINPPMAQQPPPPDAPPNQAATRSWKKIMVWSTIAMLLALLLPYTSKTKDGGSGSCLVK